MNSAGCKPVDSIEYFTTTLKWVEFNLYNQFYTMSNNYIAILAGGVGTRFWPSSREAKPKQFLDILGLGKSLLRMTYDRFADLVPDENMYCVTNVDYTGLVQNDLPHIPGDNIIGEPSRNNTAPCILYTALLIAGQNPEAVIGFVPSDHLILKEDIYRDLCQQAFDYAATHEAIVTLGITPRRPDTGYGYIHFEPSDNIVKKVRSFREKPDESTARSFLDSGDYLWNAGMFFMSVKTLIKAYQTNEPEMHALLEPAVTMPVNDRATFLSERYPLTRNVSVDYAILEKSPYVYTIPAEIGWSDLGTWASLHQESGKDATGNVVMSEHILLENVHNSLIKNNTGKLVILRDVSDLIVIVEEDVVLVYPLGKEQEIKQLREKVKNDHFKFL